MIETRAVPTGWLGRSAYPEDYLIETDLTTRHGGTASGTISSCVEQPHDFATLMQECLTGEFLGKRVRTTAFLQTRDVLGWAGMWLRIDGPEQPARMLGFDNMQDRPLKGTSPWTQHTIVLDVPDRSHMLAYGVLLGGSGQVWIDDLQFEVVDESVPLTGEGRIVHPQPFNLDFEQHA